MPLNLSAMMPGYHEGSLCNNNWETLAYYNVLKSYLLHGPSQYSFVATLRGFNFFDHHNFIDAREEAPIAKGHVVNQCVGFGIKILVF